MKIVSINENKSKQGEIALLTNPTVSGAIYDKLRAAWQSAPLLHSNPVKLDGQLLIVRIAEVTPEIAKAIQQLLDDAEQAVQRDEEAARQKADAQKSEERKRVEAAAKVFGVPVH